MEEEVDEKTVQKDGLRFVICILISSSKYKCYVLPNTNIASFGRCLALPELNYYDV